MSTADCPICASFTNPLAISSVTQMQLPPRGKEPSFHAAPVPFLFQFALHCPGERETQDPSLSLFTSLGYPHFPQRGQERQHYIGRGGGNKKRSQHTREEETSGRRKGRNYRQLLK